MCGCIAVSFLDPVYAAVWELSSENSDIGNDGIGIVDAKFSIRTDNDTKYFIRGVFFRDSVSDACGYTWNGTDWYNGPFSNDGFRMLPEISVNEGSWSGQLRVKIDPQDSDCMETGQYSFKIQRYTQSGNATYDDQNELVYSAAIPTFTPTMTDTPKPQPTATHTKKPDPTALPQATSTHATVQSASPTLIPVKSSTPKQTLTPTDSPFIESSRSMVLGIENEQQVEASESSGTPESRIAGISAAFIGMGFISLSIALYYGIYAKQKNV